jgi:hypothetical protein
MRQVLRSLLGITLVLCAAGLACVAYPLAWLAQALRRKAETLRPPQARPVTWVARPRLVLPQCAIEAILRQHEAAVMCVRERVH